MNEAEISARWLLNVGARPGVRMFRNTIGEGWQGQVVRRDHKAGTVTLLRPRYVTFGLAPGSADLIGWSNGGLFTAAEIKIPGGRYREGQKNFLDNVRIAGGIALTIFDPDDISGLVYPDRTR